MHQAWLTEWFGLPLVGAGVDAMVTSRLLAHAIFFDPDAAAMDAAVASADALCRHLVAAMDSPASAPGGSLAAALLACPRDGGSAPEATKPRDLLGQ